MSRIFVALAISGAAHALNIVTSSQRLIIPEGSANAVYIRLDSPPPPSVPVYVIAQLIDIEQTLILQTPLAVFTDQNWNYLQPIFVFALPDRNRFNHDATLRLISSFTPEVRIPIETLDLDPDAIPMIRVNQTVTYMQPNDPATFLVHLSRDPGEPVNVNINRLSGSTDIEIVGSGTRTFDSSNYAMPQSIKFFDAGGHANSEHTVFKLSATGYEPREVHAYSILMGGGNTIYVDADAFGQMNGVSWFHAFPDLQDALAVAGPGQAIWIASGVYKPAGPGGLRTATFDIPDGVAVFGGFDGTETVFSQRQLGYVTTTLSGDLNADDGDGSIRTDCLEVPAYWQDNVYNVVSVTNSTSAITVLDGVTITGGVADGTLDPGDDEPYYDTSESGSAVRCSVWMTLSNARILHNATRGTGAVHIGLAGFSYAANVLDCVFEENYTFCNGSAAAIGTHRQTLISGCDFVDHVSEYDVVVRPQNSTLSHCYFSRNSAPEYVAGFFDMTFKYNHLELNDRQDTAFDLHFPDADLMICSDILDSGAVSLDRTNLELANTRVVTTNPFSIIVERDSNLHLLDDHTAYNDIGVFEASLEIDESLTLDGAQLWFAQYFGFTPDSVTACTGPGSLEFVNGGGLHVGGTWTGFTVNETARLLPSVITAPISGQGDITILEGASLALEGGAVVDLAAEPGAPCPLTNPSEHGVLTVDGRLTLNDATVKNASIVINNDSQIMDCGNGTGGSVNIIAGELSCNRIVSYDDRHLGLDPAGVAAGVIAIFDNDLEVHITEDIDTDERRQGKVFELWAPPEACAVDPASPFAGLGLFKLANPSCPDYRNLTNAQRLVIEQNARANLTNRAGFDVNPAGVPDGPETMYVDELVLEPNSVLNLGLQSLYYSSLQMDPSSEIINIPKLGFALEVIRFESDCEFDVRVRVDPDSTGTAERIDVSNPTNPYDSGFMEMQVVDAGQVTAASGSFAGVVDPAITVIFDYHWAQVGTANPLCNTVPVNDLPVLNVYVSDNPLPGVNRILVATIQPPPQPDLPGGFLSSEFETFRAIYPLTGLDGLDLRASAYVELELCGTDSTIHIDNWDPFVNCSDPVCGDVTGETVVNLNDYLVLLGSFGENVAADSDRLFCLDVGSEDGFVDEFDLNWHDLILGFPPDIGTSCGDVFQNYLDRPTLTPTSLVSRPQHIASQPSPVEPVSQPLAGTGALSVLISGKEDRDLLAGENYYPDYIFGLDLNPFDPAACLGAGRVRPSRGCRSFGNGPLVTSGNGDVYQIDGIDGVIRLRDGAVLVAPGAYEINGSSDYVIIGVVAWETEQAYGLTIADVAFIPSDMAANPERMFVGPVVVVPESGCPYAACVGLMYNAAQDEYQVDRVYGISPWEDQCVRIKPDNAPPCLRFSFKDDYQHITELECDDKGQLFVLSASGYDRNYLSIYEILGDNAGVRIIDGLGTRSLQGPWADCPNIDDSAPVDFPVRPTAMLIDVSTDRLLLAEGALAFPHGLDSDIQVYDIIRSGSDAVVNIAVSAAGPIFVSQPVPGYCDTGDCPAYYAAVTGLVADPGAPGGYLAVGMSAPRPAEIPDQLSTTATIAKIPPAAVGPVQVDAQPLTCGQIGVATSIVLSARGYQTPLYPPDLDSDCDVDKGDLDQLLLCLSGPDIPSAFGLSDWESFLSCFSGPGIPLHAACESASVDEDGDLDLYDWSFLQAHFKADCAGRSLDGDYDTDGLDFALLQACAEGSNNPFDADCLNSSSR